MFFFVYIITNIINNKQYVGDHSTDNLNDGYLGGGKPLLDNAKKKYGKNNFKLEILEFFTSKQEAFDAQEKYIKEFNTLRPNGYNISPKGGHGTKDCWSEESKKKVGESHKGLKHSKETIKKLSDSHKGLKLSKETKEKLSKLFSGDNHPFFGKKHTEETKQKIKEKLQNKTYNELFGEEKAQEKKQKMSKSMIGKNKGIKNGMYGKIPWNKKI